jgi:hypothetical protein
MHSSKLHRELMDGLIESGLALVGMPDCSSPLFKSGVANGLCKLFDELQVILLGQARGVIIGFRQGVSFP